MAKKVSRHNSKSMDSVRAPRDERELTKLMTVLGPLFNSPPESARKYAASVGRSNFRLIRRERKIAGGLALLSMGQFFGGRSVPMMGVAFVGVEPEYRGRGVAAKLMSGTLNELHRKRVPISTLYPATWALYRKAGYELAGSKYRIQLDLPALHSRDRERTVRRIAPADHKSIESLHRSVVMNRPGHLDRSDFIWSRVRNPMHQKADGFLVLDDSGKPDGYLYYFQKDSDVHPYDIVVTDMVSKSPAASRRLLAFLADHSSLVRKIFCPVPPTDPILSMLPEKVYKATMYMHWMVRIVHAPAALEARGYPAGINGEVHFDIADDVVSGNNGKYTLTIRNGRGRVKRGGRGDLTIDIRGLASLYSGYMSPDDLIVSGRLAKPAKRAAHSDSMTTATAAFAGPAPSMTEMF